MKDLEKNPELLAWFQKIANGDDNAFAFLVSVWNFTHTYDDLFDGDVKVEIDEAAKHLAQLAVTLAFNDFFNRNKLYLMGLFISMIDRWKAGETWPDEAERHIIKCGDVDLYLGVAYCTGGWDHLQACKGARSYDKD